MTKETVLNLWMLLDAYVHVFSAELVFCSLLLRIFSAIFVFVVLLLYIVFRIIVVIVV